MILALEPVTTLPVASYTVTTGCVLHTAPPVPPPGCVVKASFAAAGAGGTVGSVGPEVTGDVEGAAPPQLTEIRARQTETDRFPNDLALIDSSPFTVISEA
jgi:hypothetical protein